MTKSTDSWIVLLRAIGPATYKKMTMQQLRDCCTDAGLEDVTTYIATGNLLCKSSLAKSELKQKIVDILSSHGLENDVIIRKLSEMKAHVMARPLAQAAKERPNHLLTVFFDRKVNPNLASKLVARDFPEQILIRDRELCIDYVNGVARSKLTPTLIDRVIGQPGTARNWNTVEKLVLLMEE